MAKIIKIGSMNTTLTSKTANLAKTSRQGNITNPFKFSNFEGNTLQFADVFEGFEPKKQNKLRMIATSAIGSMNRMKSSITEPIVNFVRNVSSEISNAWDYAKNTNISDVPVIRHNIDGLMNVGRSISSRMESISSSAKNISDKVSAKMEFLNTDVTELWSGLVSKMHSNKFSSDMPVADLRAAWLSEISKESMEVVA